MPYSAISFSVFRLNLLFVALSLLLVGCKAPVVAPLATAEANGTAPQATPSREGSLPILFLVGDSTVHNTAPGIVGWGDVIGCYFDPAKIKVENHARPGRSSRTFQTQGWWAQILAEARPTDFVIIQLGHNDSSPINDTNRSRGTIPGIGEESTNIVNGLTHQSETVHTYGWYLRQFIADARAKGMTPILCTPVSRLPSQGKELDTTRYAAWSRELAGRENVPLIDLNSLVLARWDGKTPDEIKTNYFTPKDNTHFNRAGAELNAACVVEGLRRSTNCTLTEFLLKEPTAAVSP
ncbi:MAG: rhamnogalacturonan acetylesterase [Verrucomicrobiota bacterium]